MIIVVSHSMQQKKTNKENDLRFAAFRSRYKRIITSKIKILLPHNYSSKAFDNSTFILFTHRPSESGVKRIASAR